MEDVTISRGRIRIFMMVGGRAFDVRSFLEDYLRRLGLERGGCVFPKNVGIGQASSGWRQRSASAGWRRSKGVPSGWRLAWLGYQPQV